MTGTNMVYNSRHNARNFGVATIGVEGLSGFNSDK
jgi:hypothetical protein